LCCWLARAAAATEPIAPRVRKVFEVGD
jgi:hypothetical protein